LPSRLETKHLNVVLLTLEYPPYIFGGIGTFVQNLAIGLRKEGAKVTVISGYPVSSPFKEIKEEKDGDIDIIRLPYFGIHGVMNATFQMSNLKTISETIRQLNHDLIHGQGLTTFPASIKLKNLAPLVVTFHSCPKVEKALSIHSILRGGSLQDFEKDIIGYPAWSYITRKELSNSNAAVAVSKNLRADIIDEMGEGFSEKIFEIHNGIDIERLESSYKSVDDDIREENTTILFAGRLVWKKGVLNLINLAVLLKKEQLGFKLIVHGDGPLFKVLERKARELGLTNIELKGFATGIPFMESMKKSKFVVIPSFHEACPMILLESMCLGKIPIMFNFPFSKEFTDNGKYGIIASDIEDMVKKLKVAIAELDLQEYSEDIKEFSIVGFNVKSMASRYMALYKKIVE
jgi:glycogen(starch) synthase